MSDPNRIVFDAIAFAARAHRHQLRKDRDTPYVSHVFRVCLVVRHVFGLDDPRMLAAALLHDTIEDTATDCDDITERFGPDVARWVAALTKDMRLPHDEREAVYLRTLAAADWQVKVCKLADVYDNLGDCRHLSPQGRNRTAAKSRLYLNAVRTGLPPEAEGAIRLVEERLAVIESGMA
jgi:(p)ppGpp synthase/HD superfamily hydrolase